MTTREQIIAVLKEAGFDVWVESVGPLPFWIERFYTLVANQTKDQCAALCYEHNWLVHGEEMSAMILATKEEVK